MPLDSSTSITLTLTGVLGSSVVTNNYQVWDIATEWEFTLDGLSSWATRTIIIAWDEYASFISLLRNGGYYLSGSYAYYEASVYVDAPFLVFDSAKGTGIPVNGLTMDAQELVAYKYAEIVIRYKALRYPEGADAAIMRVRYFKETRTIPYIASKPMYQFSDGTYMQAPWTISVGGAEIEVTLFNCSQIPSATFQPLIMQVNSSSMTISAVTSGGTPVGGSFTGATGTIRLDGVSTQEKVLVGGSYNFDCTYSLSFRQIPWLNELVTNPASASYGAWLPITTTVGGNPPYVSGNLTSLFTPS